MPDLASVDFFLLPCGSAFTDRVKCSQKRRNISRERKIAGVPSRGNYRYTFTFSSERERKVGIIRRRRVRKMGRDSIEESFGNERNAARFTGLSKWT
ncbi:hypothetical protein GWI33_006501 [Rhynchophorus ferrugineus]|uniref:Uncharacterized protein n=1 Tax=Rhynchophorus ferrugineus TaxID=354439 RepID=A0A834ILN1_RHYFE|nr:hypothetical protein GWI33_006501 [Rhynchophorus ferrugineus]